MCPSIISAHQLFHNFPIEYGAILAGWVGTDEVHGVGAACCWALAEVAVVLERVEHEVVIKIVLPEELGGESLFAGGEGVGAGLVGGEADIAWESVAIDLDEAAVGTLEGYHT